MLNTEFSPWPSFSEEEAQAVKDVLLSNRVNYWTGDQNREFEKEFAAWVGVERAITVANGSLALELALKAIGIQSGDEVITTPRTFLASASSIVMAGGIPVFADVDLNSQNISASTIKEVISDKTKAVIVVHLAGMPAEMDEIMALCRERGIYVIEDCAQAHGAKYNGKSVGSIGDIGAWSFCQDKIMTTGGEGGMVTTNNEELWKKMWSFKDHGKSWDAIYNKEHPPGFRWLHDSFGTNWRMTEMQAVIGRIQLTKIENWKQARIENAAKIDEVLAKFDCIRTVEVDENIEHAEYKHYAFVKPEKLKAGWSRDKVVEEIVNSGVPCFQGSCSEVYLEKAFSGSGWVPKSSLENAKLLGETSLMFLVHPTLTPEEMEKTVETIRLTLESAQAG